MDKSCADCKHYSTNLHGFQQLCTAPQLKVTMEVKATYAYNVRGTGALCGPVGRWYDQKEKE